MSEKRFVYEEEHFPIALRQIKDTISNKTYDLEECCELLNELNNENKQLKKSEKINMEYAEQIVEENRKFRIAKNDLRIKNEQQEIIQSLKSDKAIAEDYANIFEKENVKLRKQIDEQQATINKLKSDIEETEISIKLFEDDVNRLSKENEQLRQSVEYWQKKYEEGTETFQIN